MTDIDGLLEPQWTDGVCHTAQALEDIDDEDRRAKVAAAARNERVPIAGVIDALGHLGVRAPKPQSLRRHRRGECDCP